MKNKKKINESIMEGSDSEDEVSGEPVISSTEEHQPPYYEHLEENIYLIDKKKRINKEVRRMQCECTYDPDETNQACGEDCLNRLLMIECNGRCRCGEFCTNKRFQQGCKVKVEVFKTEKKGWGLKVLEGLEKDQFVMEYCGEVMSYGDFQDRAERYDRENRRHYYFMTLRANEIIDATYKGNLSRFINHSCDPNCVTQKWTVNGLLRIGFFTLRRIDAGEELTFDYQFQRYGKIAQYCYCGSTNCRGIIGGEKHTPLKQTYEKIASSSSASPRRRKKRNLASEFDDVTLEDEVDRLIGENGGMCNPEQALRLSRLMVRAETAPQRIRLLQVLKKSTDQACLRAFIRFQGLSLLWSWMIEGGKTSKRLQKGLLEVLSYLPIVSKNQVEDSKIIKVVRKWAATSSEGVSTSSGQESRGNSPADSSSTPVSQFGCIPMQDSSVASSEKPLDKRSLLGKECPTIEDNSEDEHLDEEVVGSFSSLKFKVNGLKRKQEAESSNKSPDDGSDDEERKSTATEDEDRSSTSSDDEEIGLRASELLKSWSTLKEIYRIPKISTPDKKNMETSKIALVSSVAESSVQDEERSTTTGSPVKCSLMGALDDCSSTVNLNQTAPLALMDIPTSAHKPVADTDEYSSHEELVNPAEDVLEQKPEPSCENRLQAIALMSSVVTTPPRKRYGFDQEMEGSFSERPFRSWKERNQQRKMRKFKKNKTFGYHQSYGESEGFGGQSNMNEVQGMTNIQNTSNVNTTPGGGFVPSNMNSQTGQWSSGPPQMQGPVQKMPPMYPASVQNQGQTTPVVSGLPSAPINYPSSYPPPNVLPPNIPPPNFPRNIPPPNYQQQQQQPTAPLQTPYLAGPQQYQGTVPPYNPTVPPPVSQYQYPSQVPHMTYINQQGQLPQFSSPATLAQPQGYTISQAPQQISSAEPFVQPVPCAQQGYPTPQACQQPYFSPEKKSVSVEENQGHPSPPPPRPNHKWPALPPNWRTATDPEGKVYYYHAVTRQTQWDPPKWEGVEFSSPISKNGGSEESMESKRELSGGAPVYTEKKIPRTPCTPPGSPPQSPTLKFTTAAADTTRRGHYMSPEMPTCSLSPKQQKIRDSFRMKLANVVVNCLNPYFKVDCKIGRITNSDDFKYLARKMTHGIMVKEIQHIKNENELQCSDSVKIKTKEYIRNYMIKFGPVYRRS